MARKRKSIPSDDAPPADIRFMSKSKTAKNQKTKLDWNSIKTPVNWKIHPLKASQVVRGSGAVGPSPAKRRKSDNDFQDNSSPDYDPDDDPHEPHKYQSSPFEGTNVGVAHYQVKPSRIWLGMNRYRKFSIQSEGFMIGDFVYVKNLDAEQDDAESELEGAAMLPEKRWVAKVLEVRATDASHVFLRIYWMYRPEDLPTGRLPYHGSHELIASNHMDIIDAAAVDGKASVVYWQEDSDSEEPLNPLQFFWRQTFDIYLNKHGLSHLPLHCIDKREFNPNELLVQCDSCKGWLHNKCIENDAVQQAQRKYNLERTKSPSRSNRGRRRLRGRSDTNDLVFSAHLTLGDDDNKLTLTITDHRPGHVPKAWNLPFIPCLLCGKPVEDSTAMPKGDDDITNNSSANINNPSRVLCADFNLQDQASEPTNLRTPSSQPSDEIDSPTSTSAEPEHTLDAVSTSSVVEKNSLPGAHGTVTLIKQSEEVVEKADKGVEKVLNKRISRNRVDDGEEKDGEEQENQQDEEVEGEQKEENIEEDDQSFDKENKAVIEKAPVPASKSLKAPSPVKSDEAEPDAEIIQPKPSPHLKYKPRPKPKTKLKLKS